MALLNIRESLNIFYIISRKKYTVNRIQALAVNDSHNGLPQLRFGALTSHWGPE